VYRTEEEQEAAIKAWWEKNGVKVVVAIVLSITALLGWRQWDAHKDARATDASALYQQLLSAVEEANADPATGVRSKAEEAAEKLLESHAGTVYAEFAHMMLARFAVENADLDSAAEYLESVLKSPALPEIEYTARLRLARVYLQKGDHQGALGQLAADFPEPWQGRVQEVRGDVLRAQRDLSAASDAYSAAIDLMSSDQAGLDRVRMKLADIDPTL